MQPARRAGAEPRVGRCASWLPAPSAVRSQLPSLTPVSSQGWGRVFYVRAPALGSARRAGRSARSRVRASAIIGPRRQAWKERGNGAVGRDLWWRYLVGLVWRGVAWCTVRKPFWHLGSHTGRWAPKFSMFVVPLAGVQYSTVQSVVYRGLV